MKISQRLLTYGCALAVVCLLVTSGLAGQSASPGANRVTQAPDGKTRVTLTGNVHPLARAKNSRGAVENSLIMPRILLLLKRSGQQEAALQSLLEAQQDKSSPNYHAWLTPDQFGKQFGASDTDLQAVTDWLTAQGFQNVQVAAGRTVIEFSGSAGQVQNAFGTQIQNYAVNGTAYVANSTDPQIPAALAAVVAGVVSLHNFPKKSHARFLGDARMNATSHKLQPLFTFPDPGGNGNFYGVGPGDFATIYNTKPLIASGNDGTGQTIAIVGETQINPRDVSDFRTMFGLTNNFSAANIILNGMDPGITSQDEESESDLDVQWSGAVAPGATVKLVVSAGTSASSGIDLSALYIVEHNLADVLSESYGACESDLGSAGNAFFKGLWEQAAAQGITVVVSSGDGGSAGCDDFNTETIATRGLAVSGIAGTPFNVSVGGTDFNQFNSQTTYWNTTNDTVTGTSATGYIPEFPWNENCSQLGLTGCGATAPQGSVNIVAGSGGASSVYAKPKWQMGVAGMPNDNHRDQPDVSLFASPGFEGSGYLFCQADLTGVPSCNLSEAAYTFHIIGGTSASAPAFAGMMALVNQYAAAHGGSSRQGNANNILYALAKKSGSSCTSSVTEAAGCVFNDVAAPNIHHPSGAASNSVACKGGTLNCSATLASGTGVLVDPAHTTTEAWTAGAGYDLATGLGSLNANNLAVAWGSASTIGTTTTLSLSPTTGITHGQNENVAVTVNVKASTGTGIPSGDVAMLATLADGSTVGIDQFTLSNGAVTSTKTQNLPGGTYKVYAHYTGDGTDAPSDSPSVQVTVGKEASQTFIVIPTFDSQGKQTSGNANSVVYGSNYIIRMYVANSAAAASTTGPPTAPCYTVNEVTCPTGSVALSANGLAIDGGSFTLNNQGYSRDIAPTLTGGTYPLVAKYSGDNSYTASTSATDTFTVTPATMQLSLTLPNSVLNSMPFTIYMSGTTSAVGAAPMGTLTVYDGSTSILTVPLGSGAGYGGTGSGSGPTAYAGFGLDTGITLSTFGPHSLTMAYTGDPNYSAAPTTPQIVHVVHPTSMTLQSNATTVTYGTTVTLTAALTTSQTGPPVTGQITFESLTGQTTVTTGPTTQTVINGFVALQATATVTMQSGDIFAAKYSGDDSYEGASASSPYITVNNPDFSIVTSQPTLTITAGQSANFNITIIPTTAMTGSVQLQITSPSSGINCNVSPSQVQLAGSNSVTASLTCSVPAPSSASSTSQILPLGRPKPGPRNGWLDVSGVLAAIALAFWLLPVRPQMRRRLAHSSLALALSTLSFAVGCGGVGGSGGGGGVGGGTAPTIITLTAANTKVPPGSNLIATAQVSGTNSPTGSVSLGVVGESWSFNTANLVNGSAQFSYYLGSPGGYLITAQYRGDSRNLASEIRTPLTVVQTGIAGGVTIDAIIGPTRKEAAVTLTVQ